LKKVGLRTRTLMSLKLVLKKVKD